MILLSEILKCHYSHELHNDVSMNDGLHILQWSDKIVAELKIPIA